jgi:2-haloacid dehalogenase
MTIDPRRFEALTFDCYGTLIDWEAGILAAATPVLEAHGITAEPEALLEAFARHEAAAEAGPYRTYREVLADTIRGICAERRVEPGPEEVAAFAGSVVDWPPFADSADALRRLASRYRLGVITNCDDDLFEASRQRLGVAFDPVVTAQQVRGYKPAERNFHVALERLGLPRERVLHVAQSLYHDHVPVKRLGLATVWVDRRAGRAGAGATPPAEAMPDLTVPDLATLARLLVDEQADAPAAAR